MAVKGSNGSEIHRLKEFKSLDNARFERLYKLCRPLVRRLSKEVDARRYQLTSDIIRDYFWDKFMYVYSKYEAEYDDEHLKASLLSALQTYKNKLLRSAYSRQSEFYQTLTSFEDLFDDSKEFIDDTEEARIKEAQYIAYHQYLEKELTPDEYLLYKVQVNPPPYFYSRMKESHGKLSILHLIDYFELPRNRKSQVLITQMRNKIRYTLKRAETELR